MARKIVARKDGHTVTVDVEGPNIEVVVDGINGPSCIEVTKALVDSMGGASSSEHTDEYYAAESAKVGAGS